MKLLNLPLRSLGVLSAAVLVSGCTVYEAPATTSRTVLLQPASPPVRYAEAAPSAEVSVYLEPPVYQPPPVFIDWAPPPMRLEPITAQPYGDAVWVGGYWVWQNNWVWATGHWRRPPRPNYGWVPPYYEHRHGGVVFVNGHWCAPGAVFVPPPLSLSFSVSRPLPGVVQGPPPIGPQGVFVPPPPGSRHGLIVPAPLGTPPAVVINAAPVVNIGMRIEHAAGANDGERSAERLGFGAPNLTVVAPGSATASGRPFERRVAMPVRYAEPAPAVIQAAPAVAPAMPPGARPPADPAGRATSAPVFEPVTAAPVPRLPGEAWRRPPPAANPVASAPSAGFPFVQVQPRAAGTAANPAAPAPGFAGPGRAPVPFGSPPMTTSPPPAAVLQRRNTAEPGHPFDDPRLVRPRPRPLEREGQHPRMTPSGAAPPPFEPASPGGLSPRDGLTRHDPAGRTAGDAAASRTLLIRGRELRAPVPSSEVEKAPGGDSGVQRSERRRDHALPPATAAASRP